MLVLSSAAFSQEEELEKFRQENAALKAKIEEVGKILEGTAKPVNLGRTSLAAVEASRVNGGREQDNEFYGVQNAFDDGSNIISGINYTWWLADSGANHIKVNFDHPVTVTSIVLESAPACTPVFYFRDGEEPHGEFSDELKLPRPIHGVVAVKLNFAASDSNTSVHEVRIMGYPPVDLDRNLEPQRPRLVQSGDAN